MADIFYRLAWWALVGTILLFVWRRNRIVDYGESIPALKPSDLLVLLAALFLGLAWFLGRRPNQEARDTFIYWIRYPAIFFGFSIVGSILGSAEYWRVFSFEDVASQFIRLGLGILIFSLILILGTDRRPDIGHLFWAFSSVVVLIPFLYISEVLIIRWHLVASPVSYAFLGFHPSTIELGSLLVLGTVVFGGYFLSLDRPILRRVAALVVSWLLIALMWWTASRAAWLSAAVALGAMIAIVFWKQKAALAVNLIIFVGIFMTSLISLPPLVQNTVLARVFPDEKLEPIRVSQMVIHEALSVDDSPIELFFRGFVAPSFHFPAKTKNPPQVNFVSSRGSIWIDYLKFSGRHPLGVGPDYSNLLLFRNNYGQSVNAHNTWLEVLVIAGIGGFLAVAFLIFSLGRSLVRSWRRPSPFAITATGFFIGLITNVTFADSLEIRWFWAVLGLAAITVPRVGPLAPTENSGSIGTITQ